MRIRCMMTLAILGLAVPALAQDEGIRERPGRERMGRPGRGPRWGRGPGGMFEHMSRRLVRTLELDEQQAAELDEIVAEFRQRMAEMAPGPDESRGLWREMRDARESGDQARVDELRGQMREMRAGGQAVMEQFFAEVEPILNEEQVERLDQMRERFAEVRREGERRGRMRRMIDQLPDRLELDDEQRAQYEELTSELRGQRAARWERWRELRPLMEELREAEEAGDEERVGEIRAQLEAARTEGRDPQESFYAALEQILTEEQRAKLAEIRAGQEAPGGEAQPEDLRAVVRAAQRLDLDKGQRSAVREIVQRALRASRKLGRREREAQTELVKQVKQEIVTLLNAEQVEQFERILKGERPRREMRERPRMRGRSREAAGERPQEPEPEPEPDTP